MKRFGYFFSLLLILVFPEKVFSQGYKTETGNVEFLSKASLNEFTGKSSNLNGLVDFDKNLLDFYVDLNTIDTGIGLRDRHMRENYLETKEFPYAEFTGEIAPKIDIVKGQSKKVTAIGNFKIHGVEKEIEVTGKLYAISDTDLQLEAEFTIMLSDFNIEIPKVVFYELAEEQKVSIKAILKK
jgi:polyisoprenoid-binding protein YceI